MISLSIELNRTIELLRFSLIILEKWSCLAFTFFVIFTEQVFIRIIISLQFGLKPFALRIVASVFCASSLFVCPIITLVSIGASMISIMLTRAGEEADRVGEPSNKLV